MRRNDSDTPIDTSLTILRSTGFTGIANINPTVQLDVGSSGTNAIRVNRTAITDFSSLIIGSAGADRWSIQLRNDSANNFHYPSFFVLFGWQQSMRRLRALLRDLLVVG